jgi:hypothetical protein
MGDFLLCKFNRIWGERVTGDGTGEAKKRQWKSAKVQRWKGRIRGQVDWWTGGETH